MYIKFFFFFQISNFAIQNWNYQQVKYESHIFIPEIRIYFLDFRIIWIRDHIASVYI